MPCEVENVICSRPGPPVPLSSSVTLIELGSIGIVTSSAVPRMPSGPALINWIDAAVKWVRSMFWLVVTVNCDLTVGQAGDDLAGRR